MIKEIILDNHVLKYQITFKNNKNTYFYFKKNGYIQINASRYQTHKDIFNFIKKNKESFIKKYEKTKLNMIDDNNYYLFGNKYTKVSIENVDSLQISYIDKTIIEPNITIDQLKELYKKMEKKILINKLFELKEKYINNKLINLENITFKTRYMHTRFGSSNPKYKSININLYLVNFNEKYLEYVFLHEIVHLVHHNHSKEYYALLSKFSKNYKQIKKELNSKFNNR
ncbi:MAG: M48 family metallopeptidase [Candidatus Izimaplasma sp.]|nr:M48 family metallopeptidase [Candidatus Izimaplasma bacterium]